MADQQQTEQTQPEPAAQPDQTQPTQPDPAPADVPAGDQPPTQSDAPVQAREQLQQVEQPGGNLTGTLEKRASDQEAQQSEALQSSLSGAAANVQDAVAEAPAAVRAGTAGQNVPTQGGFMDQASRRSGDDALEGHFVRIDLSFDGVREGYEEANLADHRGDYGVYLTPVSLNQSTGIPELAIVRLRDETNARVTVPYEALRPAEAGGR